MATFVQVVVTKNK